MAGDEATSDTIMSDSTSKAANAIPGSWAGTVVLRNGTSLLVRPMQPEDDALMASFVRNVSVESARNRFHFRRSQLTTPEIHRLTHIDYRKEMAFVAIAAVSGQDVQTGVARYCVDEGEKSAEFALLIADDWQNMGVGRVLLAKLTAYATSAGLESLHGVTYSTNDAMLKLARKEGFQVSYVRDEPSISEMRKHLR